VRFFVSSRFRVDKKPTGVKARRTTTTTTMGDEGRTTEGGEDGDDCDLYHALGLARDATKLEVRCGRFASPRARARHGEDDAYGVIDATRVFVVYVVVGTPSV
jgi:hypothetical protein